MSQAAIRVQDLTKCYKRHRAVDRLSLEVPTGSVFGLLGENGAGKTTTIRSMLGLIAPDEGRVETLGLDPVAHGLEVRRRVGYVAEQPSFYDWMTVAEAGWFAAGFHPRRSSADAGYERRYQALVEGFGLPAGRPLKQLSKGMRSRVALSLALASDPEVLILDEPTSGLDVLVRRDFLESMVGLAGEGRTVLLSSHQIAEVERIASHVALLHQGKLILAEPLDALKARTYVLDLRFSGHDHPASPPPGSAIELVDVDESPRQGRWLVHVASPSVLESLRALPGVVDLEIGVPTLEEIYIGYMRRRLPSGPPAGRAVQVA